MADTPPAGRLGTTSPRVTGYEFGRFRIKVTSRHVYRNGEVVPLTSKAFDTLLLLVAHRDRVVAKDELMKAVWPHTFVSDDSLTQAIASVRRALGDAEFVATIPRRGYRFIAPAREITTAGDVPMAVRAQPAAALTPGPLDVGPEPAGGARANARQSWARLTTATLVLAGLGIGVLLERTLSNGSAPPIAGAPLRFTQEAPPGTHIVSGGVLSPDARSLAFVASDLQSGVTRLWVRDLDAAEPRAVPGTESAERPFWSPDSQAVGFVANGKLKAVSLNGAASRTLAPIRSFAAGAAWGRDLVLFSNWRAGLDAVAPWGGRVWSVTPLDASRGEIQHRMPQLLPDARHYLFYLVAASADRAGIYIGTIGSSDPIRLLDGSHEVAVYVPPGYLLFVRGGALMAQRFNPARLQLEGRPTTIASNVTAPTHRNSATLSAAGNLLAYSGGTRPPRLAWFDRDGRRRSTIDTPTSLNNPVFSPDGKRLLAQSFESDRSGVWLLDMERDTPNWLVPDGSMPMLSPDGNTVVFGSYRGASVFDLYTRRLTGEMKDVRLLHTDEPKFVNDWTRDGRYIVYASSNAKTGEDVWVLPTFGDKQPIPYLRSEFNEIQSRVSPDGRWIAYASNESGTWEVYVQSFPVPGAKQIVSVSGGAEPVWRGDGHELFYLAANRTLMSVEVSGVGATLIIGRPVPLFRLAVTGGLNNYRSHYAVTPDGTRFIVAALDTANEASIIVISNWTALLQP